jgi:hypothetical protein
LLAPTKKFDPYPGCNVNRNKLGDGKCDGGEYNNQKCGWDGGKMKVYLSLEWKQNI